MDTSSIKPLIETEGEAEASAEGMDRVHDLLDQYWHVAGETLPVLPDSTWRALFDSCVAEIAGNIVRHAYNAHNSDGATMHISLRCFLDRMEAVLTDQGAPYMLVPETRAPDMTKSVDGGALIQGWGLPIVRAAGDGLYYERSEDGINRWRVDKIMPS